MAERTLRLIFENPADNKKTVTISVPLCDDTKTAASIRTAMGYVLNLL